MNKLLVLLTLLAGCSQNNSGTEPKTPSAPQPEVAEDPAEPALKRSPDLYDTISATFYDDDVLSDCVTVEVFLATKPRMFTVEQFSLPLIEITHESIIEHNRSELSQETLNAHLKTVLEHSRDVPVELIRLAYSFQWPLPNMREDVESGRIRRAENCSDIEQAPYSSCVVKGGVSGIHAKIVWLHYGETSDAESSQDTATCVESNGVWNAPGQNELNARYRRMKRGWIGTHYFGLPVPEEFRLAHEKKVMAKMLVRTEDYFAMVHDRTCKNQLSKLRKFYKGSERPTVDVWGNELLVWCRMEAHSPIAIVKIISVGPDGVYGTEDDISS